MATLRELCPECDGAGGKYTERGSLYTCSFCLGIGWVDVERTIKGSIRRRIADLLVADHVLRGLLFRAKRYGYTEIDVTVLKPASHVGPEDKKFLKEFRVLWDAPNGGANDTHGDADGGAVGPDEVTR